MKIGVVGDTHENVENLRTAAQAMREVEVSKLIHLGDNLADTWALAQVPIKITGVPGVFSPEYGKPEIENRRVEQMENFRALLTHTLDPHENDLADDPDPGELIKRKEVDVVLYGHTHEYAVEIRDGVALINPGHLKKEDEKGPSSYAILDVEGSVMEVTVYDLSGAELSRKRLEKTEKGVIEAPAAQ